MSVDKVTQQRSTDNIRPESTLSNADILAGATNGNIGVVSEQDSEEYNNTVETTFNRDHGTPVDKVKNGEDTGNNFKDSLRSKSFDPKSLIPQSKSSPTISGYLIQPSVATANEFNIEDVSANELADRYSDSLLGAHKHGYSITHKTARTCLLNNTSDPKSASFTKVVASKSVYRIPVINAASDELVEKLESISSGSLKLEDRRSTMSGSLVGTSGIESMLKSPSGLGSVSSESLDFDEGKVTDYENEIFPEVSSQASIDEIELAQYTLDPDHAGWKLDRRSSGQLFWRRDSSSLNGIDPSSRVKFRYDVEVCEFESRNSEAEDGNEDDDAEVLECEDDSSKQNIECISQASLDRSEHSSSATTVIYAVAIIAIVMGVLYRWVMSGLEV